MWKKLAKAVCWIAVIAFLAVTVTMGWGANKDGSASTIKLGLDLAGGVSITYQAVGDVTSQEMADAVYILQKRAEGYSADSEVYQEGSNRINIDIPGVGDANTVLREMGKPGDLYFIRQYDSEGNINYELTYSADAEGNIYVVYELTKSIDEIIADGSVILSGSDVKTADAAQQTNQTTGARDYVVELVLNESGTSKFAEATKIAYNGGQSIAIYYDNAIISAPSVSAIITDGNAIITGMESYQKASNIATTIRIGALPVKLEEIRSNVVGATLGKDAIRTSLIAGAIGIVLVMLFLIIIYRVPGFAASIALTIYTMLVLIVINLFQLTLTLPGIAGIILGIGMAVDANVIIFARIKEELATGKTVKSAMKLGFSKALSAILDGNITTLIAAIVLGIKGSGAVKSFAYTLGIGIVVSMFTALVVTRILLNLFYEFGCKSEKLYGVAKETKTINFVGKKNIFFCLSAVVILIGAIFMGVNAGQNKGAFNYSLEFKGGFSTTVTFTSDYSQNDIEEKIIPEIVAAIGDSTVQQQKVSGTNQVIFKTMELSDDQKVAMDEALKAFGVVTTTKADGTVVDEIEREYISASVSNEMRRDAFIAVGIATVCMLLYIWFRFKDVRFAASAVIALIHDVLVVLAFYAVARISVGNTFIACMLTIVGYSINATIVIFDRIRENYGTVKKLELKELVNLSISQTLARTINTSLTTFFMVFVLLILGVTSVKEFAAPLMVGIICGGYSSVCITGALWYVLKSAGKKSE